MSGTLRMREVVAYRGVTHQRVTQMYAEGKLPEPEQVDGVGAVVEAFRDQALGRARVVGHAAVAEAPEGRVSAPRCPWARPR